MQLPKRKKLLYGASIFLCTLVLLVIFTHPKGMLYSVFVIDLIMAVYYLIDRKHLSPKLKLPIAFTRLIGDTFAGLYYWQQSKLVAVLAALVFLCNLAYLYLCLEERDPL